jgi:hypothetical protein
MKKGVLAITAVLFLTVSGLALAQMDKGKEVMGDKGMGMMKGDMMDKGGMMGGGKMMGMMGMCPMMQSMMQKQVVATNDGGIVVVTGNKITKYDKDLNVVKEVEQKMDMEGMQKMMENMKSICPMMKGMMDNNAGAKNDSIALEKEVDHASHH